MIRNPGDFVGNEAVSRAVCEMLDSLRFPRLIVIEGEVGVGKKTLASIIAKAAVCTGESIPCGKCSGCIKFDTGHPDVCYIEPEKDKKSIGVNVSRDVINSAYVRPNEARYKVFVANNADILNNQSQNALLKVVEDGPENVLFIFVCTNQFKLLETILSRAVVFHLAPVEDDVANDYLQSAYPEYSGDSVKNAVMVSSGNIGKALQVLNGTQNESFLIASELCNCISENDELGFATKLLTKSDDRVFLCDTLYVVSEILRDAMCCKLGYNKYIQESVKDISESIASKRKKETIEKNLESVLLVREKVSENINTKLLAIELTASMF